VRRSSSVCPELADAKFKYDQAAAELVAHKQDIEFLKSLKTQRNNGF
jgi:hypothetical protein